MKRTIGALVLCTVACSQPDAGIDISAVELDTPSAPGSGEPYLTTLDQSVLMSWTEPAPEGGHHVMTARLVGDAWTDPVPIVQSDSLFVNWADFPMVEQTAPGVIAAHWLARGPAGGMDYRVDLVTSTDGGKNWSEPFTPHEDGTPTEHGFVSHFGMPDGRTGLVWLDGRNYALGDEARREMTLRFREVDPHGDPGPEVLLDARTCDCCQTAAAVTSTGPIVAYRDRSPTEIRDIAVVRWTPDGWTDPEVAHHDGWEIPGCPVNGPALAARGDNVALAWFTAAEGTGRVYLAFSDDAGRSFGPPIQVDHGNPEGRVDLALTSDGTAWVSWLERTAGAADVRLRGMRRDGTALPSIVVAASSDSRAAGFPRMAVEPSGSILLAWTEPTEPSRIRMSRIEVPTHP